LAPVGGFALVELARQDAARFEAALQAFGYYKGRVGMTIAGRPIDDPGLADFVDRAPAAAALQVATAIDVGPRFRFGRIDIEGHVPVSVTAALGLASGQPALAAEVVAGQDRLLAALRDAGYPLAQVTLLPATADPDRSTLDLAFRIETGPQANLGPIRISGLRDMRESFVRERLLLQSGQRFNPRAIEAARSDLMELGTFSVVRMVPADQLDASGALPMRIDVTERPLHAVEFGASYSTDLGVGLTASWRHRNLFGGAEQLNLTGAVQHGGNATTKPGYSAGAQYRQPDFLTRDQTLEISVNAVKQSLQAYDQTAVTERIALNRRLSPHWTVSVGLFGEQEQIIQEGVTTHYNLVGLPISAKYDSTDNLLDPTKAIRASFSVTPTLSLASAAASNPTGASTGTSTGTPTGSFVIMQAAGSTYFDLGTEGRSVLALRGLIGQVSGSGVFGLPPDQRFYAGGSGTVRGYRFQSIGPQFASNRPTGGNAISTGTIEFRQRFLDSYGVVGFVDAGQVGTDAKPFSGTWRAGAGVGVRYYTSIGPIRLDIAVPLNKQPGGDSLELYIGIGQAF
jgi:translocation and assembly module TamA